MRRIRSALLLSVFLGLAVGPVYGAGAAKKAAPAKKAPAKPATPAAKKPAPPPKKGPAPMVNAEAKKALLDKMAGFKFGMTKDEILGVLQKQISERYEEQIKATTDVAKQDRLRKDKKTELARIAKTYEKFDGGKTTGWDVSIIEGEFAHNTNEAMMERWENDNGKNNRRFFFFYNDRLWKMYISLDVTAIPEEKRNFETVKGVMEGQYGKGQVDGGTIAWRAGEFDARAIDKLKDYGALGLVLEDPKVRTEVLALRESRAPKKEGTPNILNAVIDKNNEKMDVKSNAGAVDAVIQAQGGGK